MLPEIVAIFSAIAWAGDAVLVRLGTRGSNIFAAMLVSFFVSATCVWLYLISFSSFDFLKSPAMLYFLASGCLQPLLARALFYEGITRMGVSRAGPLRGAEPFFAVAIAVIFLHERPGVAVYAGTVLIVASVWAISWGEMGQAKWRFVDVTFPLGAGVISAISQTLRKQGLHILPDPFVATVTVTTTSLFLLVAFLLTTKRIRLLRVNRSSLWFFVCAAFIAIERGELSSIIPLLNTTPLFAVLLSGLFLRAVETLNARLVLGAMLMVAGVVLITTR